MVWNQTSPILSMHYSVIDNVMHVVNHTVTYFLSIVKCLHTFHLVAQIIYFHIFVLHMAVFHLYFIFLCFSVAQCQ